jgi:hypothetical protein
MSIEYVCYPLSTPADLSVSALEEAIRIRGNLLVPYPTRLICAKEDWSAELETWIASRHGRSIVISFVPEPLLKCPGAWALQFSDGNYVVSWVGL